MHMSYPAPRYFGAEGEVSAVLHRADQPYDLEIGKGGTQVHYLATGAVTKGEFGLYRWDFTGPPSGPDPHFHKTISESFFVLSGTVQLYDGSRWADAGPGDFLFVPEGGIHGFRNASGEPASMLLLFAPGAPREDYFETLAEWAVAGKRPSQEEYAEFMLRHDTYWL
jgi:mannose-6-phosphate isomerase-like protein (cupin superfamily)